MPGDPGHSCRAARRRPSPKGLGRSFGAPLSAGYTDAPRCCPGPCGPLRGGGIEVPSRFQTITGPAVLRGILWLRLHWPSRFRAHGRAPGIQGLCVRLGPPPAPNPRWFSSVFSSVQSTSTQQSPSPGQPLIGCPGQAKCRGHIPPMDRRSTAGPPRWTSGEATNSRRSRTWVNPPGKDSPVGPPRPAPASHVPPRLEVMPDDRRACGRTGRARRAVPASLFRREVALRPP